MGTERLAPKLTCARPRYKEVRRLRKETVASVPLKSCRGMGTPSGDTRLETSVPGRSEEECFGLKGRDTGERKLQQSCERRHAT